MRRAPTHPRGGLTLIELVLAAALFSILMVAVFQLIEGALSLWRRGEAQRAVLEQTTSVAEVLARDLRTLESGSSGDLVIEWTSHDANEDGVIDSIQPLIRLVRQVTPAERALLYELTAQRRAEELASRGVAVDASELAEPELAEAGGLAEVVWEVRPVGSQDSAESAELVLYRGERLIEDLSSKSFLAEDFLSGSGHPPAHVLEEVCGGLLWLDVGCAAQTSIVRNGWRRGIQPAECASAWDAWRRGRPDFELHDWNREHRGLPAADELPLFPRRIRLEFEFERERDRRFRARTTDAVGADDKELRVDQPERIPRGEDSWILLDQEWMLVRGVDGDRVRVQRGERGTQARAHDANVVVHHGVRMVREVPIPAFREDWNL